MQFKYHFKMQQNNQQQKNKQTNRSRQLVWRNPSLRKPWDPNCFEKSLFTPYLAEVHFRQGAC